MTYEEALSAFDRTGNYLPVIEAAAAEVKALKATIPAHLVGKWETIVERNEHWDGEVEIELAALKRFLAAWGLAR